MPSAVVSFAVDAACGSGSSLRSIWIWVQTKHEHCSQGIVSPSCKCTLSDGGGCSWYTPSEAWQNVQLNSCREITFVSRYTTFINYLSFIHLNYVCVYYRGREERSNAIFLTRELHMLENGAIHLRICMFHPFSRCCVHNICVLEAGPSVHV